MTVRRPTFIALAISILAMACTQPQVDGTSEEAFEESLEIVRSSLPPEQRSDFDEALAVIALQDWESLFELSDAQSVGQRAREALDGKTGHEILTEARRIREEREAKEREQALAEISELREKRAAAEAAREQLAALSIVRSRFERRERSFGMPEPVIELTVKNGTEHPISRAYFMGTVASPGRAVPWIRADFNYQIPGGLEPGETAEWRLAPNSFSEWGRVEVPKDAVLTVEVMRLDGADGEALLDGRAFGDDDAERLAELESTFE